MFRLQTADTITPDQKMEGRSSMTSKFTVLLIAMITLFLVACEAQAAPPTSQEGEEPFIAEEAPIIAQISTAEATEETVPEVTIEPEAADGDAGASEVGSTAATTAADSSTPAELCEQALPASEPDTREYDAPEQVLQLGVDYRAVFCTSAGPVYVDLFEDYAPVTVNNFVFLAENDFYNNTIFHRVLDNFMAQGGDPEGTGRGGPGYQFQDEFVGFLHFDRPGLLAMANANRPEQGIVGTNGSQFFITTVPTPHLDYRHTIFGEVLVGQENVQKFQLRDPEVGGDATELHTVIIITDPHTVAYTEENTALPVADEVLAAMSGIEELLTGTNLAVNIEGPQVAADITDSIADLYEGRNFVYRVMGEVDNADCDLLNFPFMTLSYTLDTFDTVEAATAVADSTFFQQAASEELVAADSPAFPQDAPYFEGTTAACDTEAVEGRVVLQRGRYLATVGAVVPVSDNFTVDLVLDQIAARVFERPLTDVLRPEIRAE
jgi:cyclophilin family peptidyl-prolyl cis-trans isomerase